MKNICSFLACIIMLFTSEGHLLKEVELRGYNDIDGYQYIQLGEFPQEEDGSVKPILWRVLAADDEEAYLLSEYILFNNRVHPDDNEYIAFNAAFNQTEMFALLNGPFEGNPVSPEEKQKLQKNWRVGRIHIATECFKDEAFTEKEQAMLVTDEELGMVFLASVEDIQNPDYGFGTKKSRMGYATEYAIANGLFVYQNDSSPYWTRSQSDSHPYGTRCTKVEGNVGYIRCVVMNEGCRPAIRLKLEDLYSTGGSGTKEDPFVFDR